MTRTSGPAFATVILDVDSTVSGVEGIDWLAARRGANVAKEVAELTDRAMRGEIALEDVYGTRLALVRPSRGDIEALSREYLARIAPGCADVVARMRGQGIEVKLISGGLAAAIAPLAKRLGLGVGDLSAVGVTFDDAGNFSSFDAATPLATATGKRAVVEALGLRRPIVAVGDGSTDLAMRPAVDYFVCFTGFQRRDAIVRQADASVASFEELLGIVFPRESFVPIPTTRDSDAP
jgi:phosphoserine phosphatase